MGTCLTRVLQPFCSWFAGSQQQQNYVLYRFCEETQSASVLTFRYESCSQRNSFTTNSVNDEHLMFKHYTTTASLKYWNSFTDLIRNTSPLISVLKSEGQFESKFETLRRKCDIFYLKDFQIKF